MSGVAGRDPKSVNRHGHEIRPYYSTGIELPLLIGVVDEFGIEHAYVSKQEWIDERNARIEEVAALKEVIDGMLTELEQRERTGMGCAARHSTFFRMMLEGAEDERLR